MTVAGLTHHIVLRDMTEADLDAVRRIEQAAYEDAWPARVFEDELQNAFAQYRVAVALPVAGVPVGPWGMFRRDARASDHRLVGYLGTWFMVDQLHLVTIAVEPTEQGGGIGARLLLECFDQCIEAELPSIVLEVRESNTHARALYERFGFRQLGRLRQYYQDNNEDALVMTVEGLDTEAGQQAHRERWAAFRARYGTRFDQDAGVE